MKTDGFGGIGSVHLGPAKHWSHRRRHNDSSHIYRQADQGIEVLSWNKCNNVHIQATLFYVIQIKEASDVLRLIRGPTYPLGPELKELQSLADRAKAAARQSGGSAWKHFASSVNQPEVWKPLVLLSVIMASQVSTNYIVNSTILPPL